ncbi:MAG: hypothetical protein QXD15_03410 [Thermoplasmata archaeon]
MNGEEYETMEWLKEMSGRVDNGEIDAEGAEELILSCIRNFQHPRKVSCYPVGVWRQFLV